MGVFEMVIIIVAISVASKTIVKIKEMKIKERAKLQQAGLYEVQSLQRKVELLESKIDELQEQNYELQKQADRLEEHYDFVNRLLEEHK